MELDLEAIQKKGLDLLALDYQAAEDFIYGYRYHGLYPAIQYLHYSEHMKGQFNRLFVLKKIYSKSEDEKIAKYIKELEEDIINTNVVPEEFLCLYKNMDYFDELKRLFILKYEQYKK